MSKVQAYTVYTAAALIDIFKLSSNYHIHYLFDRLHQFILALPILFVFGQFFKYLIQVFLILLSFLVINYLLERVEMIILEYVQLEIFQFLVAKGAPVMPCHRLFYANLAIDMATTRNVAIIDRIETDGALKLML